MGALSPRIIGIIGWIIASVVAFYLMEPLGIAIDKFFLLYGVHCSFGGDIFTALYKTGTAAAAADTISFSGAASDGSCLLPGNNTDTAIPATAYVTPHGTAVTVPSIPARTGTSPNFVPGTALLAASVWTNPGAVVTTFAGIGQLVISVFPVLISVGFLALAAVYILSLIHI